MGSHRRLFTFPAEVDNRRSFDDVEEWVAAVRLSPQNVELRMSLCKVLARQARFDEAVHHCEECLSLLPMTGGLTVSRRLRVVAMAARLNRARRKLQAMK